MFFQKKCSHDNVPIDTTYSYCPDCGQLIENQWYLVRCACCGIKLLATSKKGIIIPASKFCTNCGSSDYTIERLEKIDCVNINYAILKKEVVDPHIEEFTQCWTNTAQIFNEINCAEKLYLSDNRY